MGRDRGETKDFSEKLWLLNLESSASYHIDIYIKNLSYGFIWHMFCPHYPYTSLPRLPRQ